MTKTLFRLLIRASHVLALRIPITVAYSADEPAVFPQHLEPGWRVWMRYEGPHGRADIHVRAGRFERAGGAVRMRGDLPISELDFGPSCSQPRRRLRAGVRGSIGTENIVIRQLHRGILRRSGRVIIAATSRGKYRARQVGLSRAIVERPDATVILETKRDRVFMDAEAGQFDASLATLFVASGLLDRTFSPLWAVLP